MSYRYVCDMCGKENVKLWRPYMGTSPLICATCAEERQVKSMIDRINWERQGNEYVGTFTGKKVSYPKWEINNDGEIPMYEFCIDGEPKVYTDQLLVDLYGSGATTTIVPAIPDESGSFWGYTSVPQYRVNWWKNLSTR